LNTAGQADPDSPAGTFSPGLEQRPDIPGMDSQSANSSINLEHIELEGYDYSGLDELEDEIL